MAGVSKLFFGYIVFPYRIRSAFSDTFCLFGYVLPNPRLLLAPINFGYVGPDTLAYNQEKRMLLMLLWHHVVQSVKLVIIKLLITNSNIISNSVFTCSEQ